MPSGGASRRGRLAVPIDRLATTSLQRLRSPKVLRPGGGRLTRLMEHAPPATRRAPICQGRMAARTARRGIESSQRLGPYRWRVERALSWMSCWRRLQVRWDRDAGRWFAFALLACALVPDCGHLSTLERPQQVTQALVEWLQA